MTGALDTRMRALALRLIAKYGKPATWTSIGTVTPNPATGTVTRTPTNYSVTITPPSSFDPASMRTASQFSTGSVATDGEAYVTLAASGLAFTPKPDDVVTFDGKAWKAFGVQTIYSGELIAAYSVRVIA